MELVSSVNAVASVTSGEVAPASATEGVPSTATAVAPFYKTLNLVTALQ